jgi:hypothetical protein
MKLSEADVHKNTPNDCDFRENRRCVLHYVTDFYFRTFHIYCPSSVKVCTKDLYMLVNRLTCFRENRRRKIPACIMEVNEITDGCTVKPYTILEVQNALVNSASYATICSIDKMAVPRIGTPNT